MKQINVIITVHLKYALGVEFIGNLCKRESRHQWPYSTYILISRLCPSVLKRCWLCYAAYKIFIRNDQLCMVEC